MLGPFLRFIAWLLLLCSPGVLWGQSTVAVTLESRLLYDQLEVFVIPSFEGSESRMSGRTDGIPQIINFSLRNYVFQQREDFGKTRVVYRVDFTREKKMLYATGVLRFFNAANEPLGETSFSLRSTVRGSLRADYFNDLALRGLNEMIPAIAGTLLYQSHKDFYALKTEPDAYPAHFEYIRRYPRVPYHDYVARQGCHYRYLKHWPEADSLQIVSQPTFTLLGGELEYGLRAWARGQYVGATPNVEAWGQLDWGLFSERLSNAEPLLGGKLRTERDVTQIRRHFVDLEVACPERPAMARQRYQWPIQYPGNLKFDFSGGPGARGRDGAPGVRGGLDPRSALPPGAVLLNGIVVPQGSGTGAGANGQSGTRGGNGGPGARGQDGAAGRDVSVYLTTVTIHERTHLKGYLTVDRETQPILFDPASGGLNIRTQGGAAGAGGSGGPGGPGGNGQEGGRGADGAPGKTCSNGRDGGPGGNGGNGGDGGDGGPGGNGGNGGNGGQVYVVADPSVGGLIDVLSVEQMPGEGGAAGAAGALGQGGAVGRGGPGGKGGPPGYCPDSLKALTLQPGRNGPSGQNGRIAGRRGQPGRPGIPGQPGTQGRTRISVAPVSVAWGKPE